jgi:hypothetical protein
MTEPSGDGSDKPRRPVAVPAIGLVALTGIGITALLGGLNEVPDKPDLLGQGAVLDQGRYDTKFVESRVMVEQGDDDQIRRFVELVFEVTNKDDETSSSGNPPESPEKAFVSNAFAGSLIKITPSFPKDAGPFTFVKSKGDESYQLHPGVKSQVIIRYRLDGNQPPPDQVTLDMGFFEEENDLGGEPQWRLVTNEVGPTYLPQIKARVTLPVKKEGGTP